MSTLLDVKKVRDYIPEKLRRIEHIAQQMDRLRYVQEALAEDVVIDIIEGWSTGDELLDFVLVACNGIYDPYVICMQYRRLYDLGLRTPGQQLLVIMKAEQYVDEDVVILRKIFIVNMRKDVVLFDIDTLSMKIPVESGYYSWMECYQNGYVISGYKMHDDDWLQTGPIHNQYSEYMNAEREDEMLYVPQTAVCTIELLPIHDYGELLEDHGFTKDDLNYFYRTWLMQKNGR